MPLYTRTPISYALERFLLPLFLLATSAGISFLTATATTPNVISASPALYGSAGILALLGIAALFRRVVRVLDVTSVKIVAKTSHGEVTIPAKTIDSIMLSQIQSTRPISGEVLTVLYTESQKHKTLTIGSGYTKNNQRMSQRDMTAEITKILGR